MLKSSNPTTVPTTAQPAGASTAAIPGNSFAGNWMTDWGTMTISVNGNVANGTYTHDEGKIGGTITGKVLKGTWSESPSYQPPNDGGAMTLTLSDDGSYFTGEWWYGDASGSADGTWVGNRTA